MVKKRQHFNLQEPQRNRIFRQFNNDQYCTQVKRPHFFLHIFLKKQFKYLYDNAAKQIQYWTYVNWKKPNRKRTVLFQNILRYLRTLHTVWSMVRRRVTRRLTRLRTIFTNNTYRKTWRNNDKISIYRNRSGTNTEPEKIDLITCSTVIREFTCLVQFDYTTSINLYKLYTSNISHNYIMRYFM